MKLAGPHRSRLSRIALFAALTCSASWAQGRVLFVDAGGSTPFPTIQSAVDASSAGDVVFVLDHPTHGGEYAGFSITGRGVTVMARPTEHSTIESISVSSIPAGESVNLVGLSVRGNGMTLSDSSGAIQLEGCDVRSTGNNREALKVTDCTAVVLASCVVRGGHNTVANFGTIWTVGTIDVVSSRVDLDRCDVIGRSGRFLSGFDCTTAPGSDGGPALSVGGTGSQVRVLGGSCIGGYGSQGVMAWCDGYGAPAATVSPSSVVFERAADVQHGLPHFTQTPAIVGPAVRSTEAGRVLEVPHLADALGSIQVSVHGEPGDTAWLVVASEGGARDFGLEEGALGLDPMTLGPRIGLGTIGASGRLATSLALGLPGPHQMGKVHVQAATHGPQGLRLSAPRVVHAVGSRVPLAPLGSAIHVDAAAVPGGDGRSWSTAATSVRESLRRAVGNLWEGGDVWLREGEYVVGSDGVVVDDPLYLVSGVALRGGFSGTESSPEERTQPGHSTILTGDALGDDGPGFSMRTDNARRFVDTTEDRRSGRPLLDRLWFRGAEYGSQVRGILHFDSPTAVVDCRVTDSRSDAWILGGDSRQLSFERCDIRSCAADCAIAVRSESRIIGCLVALNDLDRAAVQVTDDACSVLDCTIAYNTVGFFYSGLTVRHLHSPSGGTATVANTLLWNNSSNGIREQDAQLDVTTSSYDLSSCCIGGWTGNLPATAVHGLDPQFVDPFGPDGILGTLDDDFRLAPGSPCVDAGDTSLVPADLMLDLDRRPRIVDDPHTPNTGLGVPPVVDMGAFER